MTTMERKRNVPIDPWKKTNFGVFTQGMGPNKEVFFWDPVRGRPHCGRFGETGGGKTASTIATMAQPWFWEPHDADFHVYCLDGKGGGDYRFLQHDPWRQKSTLVVEINDIHDALEELVNIIHDRARLMGENAIPMYRTRNGLPPMEGYEDPVYDDKMVMGYPEAFHLLDDRFRENLADPMLELPFIFVFFDEAPEATQGSSRNSKATRSRENLRRIVSLGRFAGVYVSLGLQRPDVSFLGPSTRDQLGIRMLWGNPDKAAYGMFSGTGTGKTEDDQLPNWALKVASKPGYCLARGMDDTDSQRMFPMWHFYTSPRWLDREAIVDPETGEITPGLVNTPIQHLCGDPFFSFSSFSPTGYGEEKEEGKKEGMNGEGESEGVRGSGDEGEERDDRWKDEGGEEVDEVMEERGSKRTRDGWKLWLVRLMLWVQGAEWWWVIPRKSERVDGYREEVIEAKGDKCVSCGLRGGVAVRIEVNHKRALSLGGKNTVRNGVPLCEECHDWHTAGVLWALKVARKLWGLVGLGRGI